MSLFHKNCVLTGLLDSYCLPCEIQLATEDDIKSHILDLRHKEQLDATSYVNKHKDDGIRKVPQGYYCEYCNKLVFTAINMRLHLAEGEHKSSKDTQWLRKQGGVVIILNQLTIDEDSWHGLVNGVCALCNSEYLDKQAHKTISMHILKLIQSSVELHSSGAIYRKGDDFFHCLICNAIFPVKSFPTHFEQPDHMEFYNSCCEYFKNLMVPMNITTILEESFKNDCDDIGTIDTKEIKNPRLTKIEWAAETETNISIENDQQHFQTMKTTNSYIACEAKQDSLPKNDCQNDTVNYKDISNNERIPIRETDEDIENHSVVIAADSFQNKETSVTLRDEKRDPRLEKETKNYTMNYMGILKQPYTNYEQVSEKETDEDNQNLSEVVAAQNYLTRGPTETLRDVTRELLSNKESESDAINYKEYSDQTLLNNEQIAERQIGVNNENDSIITAANDFPTQHTNETLQEVARESVSEKNIENGRNYKGVSKQTSTNNEQVAQIETDTDNKNHSEFNISGNFQNRHSTETLQEVTQKPLSVKETGNNNHKEIWGQQCLNNEHSSEITHKDDNNHSKVTVSENSQTNHKTSQKATRGLLLKEESDNDMHVIKEISEQKPTYNRKTSPRAANKNNGRNSKIIAKQTFQTEQKTILPGNEASILPEKESENDVNDIKDILQEKFMYDRQTSKIARNNYKANDFKVTAEENFQTQDTTDNAAQEFESSLSKKEKAILISKANKIRYRAGYTRAFCSICVTNIPSSLMNIKRHVDDIKHKNNAQQIHKYVSNVMPTKKFVNQVMLNEIEPRVIDVTINETYCISLWSYLLMTRHHSYIQCHVCEVNFNVGLFDDHRNSETHKGALEKIPVVCSLPSEFVREVEPGYYHCGFCNMYEGSWRGLGDHLKLQSHLKQKSISRKRLQYALSKNK